MLRILSVAAGGSLLSLLLLAAAQYGAAPPAAHAQVLSPCEAGARLEAGEQYEAALSIYQDLLKQPQVEQCVVDGIIRIAEATAAAQPDPCAAATQFRAAGLLSNAKNAYAAILEKDAASQCARDGLIVIAALERAAQRLYLNGIEEEARASPDKQQALMWYEGALELDQAHEEAAKAVLRLRGEKDTPEVGIWYDAKRTRLYQQLTALLEDSDIRTYAVPAALLLLVIIAYAWRWNARRGGRTLKLDFQTFDKGNLEKDPGTALVASVEDYYRGLEHSGRFRFPSLISGPEATVELPADVTTLVPQLKWLSSILSIVWSNDVVDLHGTLQHAAERGAGLTLSLRRKNAIIDSTTLWQEDFAGARKTFDAPDIDDFRLLAEPAAIWTFYRLNSYRRSLTKASKDGKSPQGTLSDEELTEKLGSANWQSYAFRQAGVRQIASGAPKAAYSLFARAISLDSKHTGAITNLAGAAYSDEELKFSLSALVPAYETMRKAGSPYYQSKRTWYVLQYQLAATYDYLDMRPEARLQAAILLVDIMLALEDPRGLDSNKESERELGEFLETLLRPMTKVMLASILVNSASATAREKSRARALLQEVTLGHEHDLSVQYNLACYHTTLGKHAPNQPNHFRQALVHLRAALNLGPAQANYSLQDRSLDPLRNSPTWKAEFSKVVNEAQGS